MRYWLLITLGFGLFSGPSDMLQAEDMLAAKEFDEKVQPLLKKYCNRCHNEEKAAAKVDIARFTAVDMLLKNRKDWLKILEKLEDEEMPPEEPLPTFDERRYLIEWVDRQINDIDCGKLKSDVKLIQFVRNIGKRNISHFNPQIHG